jgi:hypothetical protein
VSDKQTETVVLDEDLIREIVDDEGRKRKGKDSSRLVGLDRDVDDKDEQQENDGRDT